MPCRTAGSFLYLLSDSYQRYILRQPDLELARDRLSFSPEEVFLGKNGLFPTPREISFGCSCPDWAILCKHVSAVLYGIAVRFDEDPLLFFALRGIEVELFGLA